MSLISMVGLADSDPVPGNYVAVNFAQGQSSSGLTNYSAILIGNKLSAGAATVDTVVYGPDTPTQMQTEDDVVSLFGRGSELHLMWKDFVRVNKSTSLYAIAVTESAGSQATGTFTLSGTATSNGTVRVIVGETVVEASVVKDDGYAAVATNVAAAINSKTDLPVTASAAASGVVTLTAKQKGLRGNFIRYSAKVLPISGVGITTTATTRTAFTGGTTADSNTTALATIANSRYYYYISAAEDATQFGAVADQLDELASPIVGLRCRAFAGSVDTLANTIVVSTGINKARDELVWQENSDATPAQLATRCASIYSLFETALGARHSLNFNFFGNDAITSQYWITKPPLDGTVPTRTAIKSAILNGISPISANNPNSAFLVTRVTTKCLDGSTIDDKIRAAHKVTVCDFFADDMVSAANSEFSGKVIGDDQVKGQKIPGPEVVTPTVFKNLIFRILNNYAERDLVEDVAGIKSGTRVVRETSPSNRLSAEVPLNIVDILNQTALNVNQVG